MKDSIIKVKNLYKQFTVDGNELKVLDDLNFEINKGEFICIVGFSGCGKSTLLRMIGGLESIDQGEILMNDEKIVGPSLERGIVFQEPRLFSWLNVRKNIMFGMTKEQLKLSKKEVNEEIDKQLKLVGLEEFGNAKVEQLSGGMKQRVSIARSLIQKPQVLLLDEPFGALDAITRINMQTEILRIWEEEQTTMIMVTHDIDEAIYLADRVIVLSSRPGKIKNIVNIKLDRPRRRTSIDFMEIRRKIYKEFFEESEMDIEYII